VTVLRAMLRAATASFRYPHFVVGRQPSYPAPPPTTVRGMLAAALGSAECPPEYEVAIRFCAAGRADDLEHQHVVVVAGGRARLPGTELPKALEGSVQPVHREFLFDCRLEVTVRGGDLGALAAALRRPAFALSMGRSQDLAEVAAVEELHLARADTCYLEDTLVPGELRDAISRGIGLVVPIGIGPAPERQPRFGRVVWVEGRVNLDRPAFVDPESPVRSGRRRGVVFFGPG